MFELCSSGYKVIYLECAFACIWLANAIFAQCCVIGVILAWAEVLSCIMGNVGSSVFGTWPILGMKSWDISASADISK